MVKKPETVTSALRATLISPNESDSNCEAANVVDGLFAIARTVRTLGHAIMPDAAPGHDAAGGTVASLTEAVMGISSGLVLVASALDRIAQAISER